MTDPYSAFISTKLHTSETRGLEVTDINPGLHPHAQDLVRWALRRGRAAIFADTGLAKSSMQAEWARHVSKHGRVLILTPLAVAEQMVRECAKFGVEARYLREDDDATRIVVTNYDLLHKFNADVFVGVSLDECFAAGTMVDTPTGPRQIESIRAGDIIVGAYGEDVVSDVHRREVPFGVEVSFGSRSCIASPNHPFFTQRGWVGAQDLRAGDYILETGSALRLVRDGVLPEVAGAMAPAFLRDVLLSELADEQSGDAREGSLTGGGSEARAQEGGVAQVRIAEGAGRTRADSSTQSAAGPEHQGEDLPPIESHRPRTFRTWRERSRADVPAAALAGVVGLWVGARAECLVGTTDSWLSDRLQDRHRQSREENRNRGGWAISPRGEGQGGGREEISEAGFTRVDGVAILEPGDPRLERLRSADGKLYFYDLGCTRHPSFSVNGHLVHNSSILKAYDGATRNAIIGSFRDTAYRLACTATPAPNDHTELGNHAEFLGVKSRVEMLAEYFCHDGGDTSVWRLKGHAEEVFWRWVCTWGAIVKRPSDLGHDDSAFILPPLRMHEHVVAVEHSDAWSRGLLFAPQVTSLSDQRATRRMTMAKRIAKAAEIAAGDEPCIIWGELNDECDEVTKAIPGAVQVAGSDSPETKAARLLGFADGEFRVIVTKSLIAGMGVNWQHCAKQIFLGASHSFEQTYQAIRRCWRFGQKRPVDVHIIRAETEDAIVENFRRKEAEVERMAAGTRPYVLDAVREAVGGTKREWNDYEPRHVMTVPSWVGTEEAA